MKHKCVLWDLLAYCAWRVTSHIPSTYIKTWVLTSSLNGRKSWYYWGCGTPWRLSMKTHILTQLLHIFICSDYILAHYVTFPDAYHLFLTLYILIQIRLHVFDFLLALTKLIFSKFLYIYTNMILCTGVHGSYLVSREGSHGLSPRVQRGQDR